MNSASSAEVNIQDHYIYDKGTGFSYLCLKFIFFRVVL